MPKRFRKNFVSLLIAGALMLLLVCVRAFEDTLFYDPFARYFHGDYLNLPFPEFEISRLLLSLTFRYLLNMIFSLGIIYVLFKDVGLFKFSAILYGVFYMILICSFTFLVTYSDQSNNFALFYVRRFLIQPLFLLLFVPAFYYQARISKING
ncbi:MAG TPA: exosortase F system-associated protein [Flavobacterium sp.]|jgi:exosortase F-associated protein